MPDDVYTHGHHASVLRSHSARDVENSAAYLIPRLRPGLTILDVGCGPGSISVDLAARVAPGHVTAIDTNEDVISAAGATYDVENLTFTVGDVYDLDGPAERFDIVHAHQVLQHVSDPVAALREMRRVCTPDGVVAARDADYAAFTWAPADERLDRWLDVYRQVAHANDAEPDAGRRLKGWALDAGFSSVEASASVWCFSDDPMRAFWGETWAERMLESDVATQALERDIATREDLESIADGFRDWVEHPDGWFTVLQGEILATP